MKGVRPASFFEETTIVAHTVLSNPFSRRLVTWLEGPISQTLIDRQQVLAHAHWVALIVQ